MCDRVYVAACMNGKTNARIFIIVEPCGAPTWGGGGGTGTGTGAGKGAGAGAGKVVVLEGKGIILVIVWFCMCDYLLQNMDAIALSHERVCVCVPKTMCVYVCACVLACVRVYVCARRVEVAEAGAGSLSTHN